MFVAVLLTVLPFTTALSHSASSFAGSTTADVFPPPEATKTSYRAYFPEAEEVGFAGVTRTGAEPEAVQTASVPATESDVYPLVADDVPSHLSFDPMRHWGNLSPWFSVGGAFGLPDASSQVPSGCELTQVHILQRHGARYPTSGTNAFAALLHQVVTNGTGFTASGPLDFLNTWTYKLGAEILTPFGRKQLYDLGVAARVQYGHLLNGFTRLPVFRTTSEWRVVQSARNWAAGFFGLEEYSDSYYESVAIEGKGFNTTLAPWYTCPNSGGAVHALGGQYARNWTNVYLANTVTRLQQYIKGVELTPTLVSAMQSLCAYETVALGYSEFCGLFTAEEWKGVQYANDLAFWYSYGPGNPLSAAQGIGYVQELLARLTQTPLAGFDTSTNGTLDGNNITFPLDQPIYMDATHDTTIAMIAVAMNFTSMAASGPLPADQIPVDLSYNTQLMVPFAAHLVGQVMTCTTSSASSGSEELIRWILNDGVVPLTGIKHCERPDNDGLCRLGDFIQGMQERVTEIDFQEDCFGTVPLSPATP